MANKRTYLVISDVHSDRGGKLKDLVPFLKGIDGVIFCGDGIVRFNAFIKSIGYDPSKYFSVCGNCDSYETDDKVITVDDRKILITHGNRYGARYGVDKLVQAAKDSGADIVLFGHSHSYTEGQKDGVFYLNPGAFETNSYGYSTFAYLIISDEITAVQMSL